MMASLRKWLFAGLLVLAPIGITVWVVQWILSTLDNTLLILPERWRPEALLGFHIPGLGVVLSLIVLLLVGATVSNFVGRKLMDWTNHVLHRIPVVRSIYSGVKQVSDTLFSENGNAFRKAVLVQWPHPGMWTIGFVTGSISGEVAHHVPEGSLSVYVPTTPNPTGGYLVVVPRSSCVELGMSVDDALKYVISMGVVAPAAAGKTGQRPREADPNRVG